MAGLQIFLQAEGGREIHVLELPAGATVRDLLDAARAQGLVVAGGEPGDAVSLYGEDGDDALSPAATLESVGLRHGCSVHLSRCKKVRVTVHYNSKERSESFGPSVPMHRIKRWAVGKKGFDLPERDAAEHVLQITGTQDRPDEDVHIGSLVQGRECAVEFDLVPKVRVEG